MKLFAIAVLGLLPLQSSTASLLGTWTGEKDGITFARLELRSPGNGLSGAMAIGDISVDKSGDLQTVKAASTTMTPLDDIAFANGVVSFTWHPDSEDNRFRFRVLSDGAGELSFQLSDEDLEELKDEGIPPPKPISLRKAP